MIIDFKEQQTERFLNVIKQLQEQPALYQFNDVAEFFQAEWRQNLPVMVDYTVSGLDDGGESFSIALRLYHHHVLIDCNTTCTLRYVAVED